MELGYWIEKSAARALVHADWANQYMPDLIDKIRFRRKPLSLSNCYESLSGNHVAIGIYDFFVNANKYSLQQHLFTAIQLKLAAIALEDYQKFEVGSEILYALLSDNLLLIDKVARLETPHYVSARSNPLHAQFKVHMLQLAILGDYEALQLKVAHLAKNGRKKDRELPDQGKDFFSLLIQGDKQGLQELITQHAKIKSQDVVTEDFMCFLGTIEAKICWLKGIQVQIGSPLLPMGLMPLEPLDRYDDVYDFLQPGWTPPPQGIVDKLSGWFKK